MPRAERREQLLAIARDIIKSDGAGALTMSALAERSGAVKPVVYDHFANSEAVILALMDEYFAGVSRYVLERVEGAADIGEFLDLAVDAMFEYHSTDRLHTRKITNGYSFNEDTNALYLEYNDRSAGFFRIILEQQGVPKALSQSSAYILNEMMLATVFEFASQRGGRAAKVALKKMLRGAVGALVEGEGAKPTPPVRVLKLKP